MKNLLEQTIEILHENHKTLEDILWFGSRKVELKGDLKNALSFKYDDGYGGQEVFKDLILVGKDFWLERHQYDGSEWWEYKTLPTKPSRSLEIGLRNLKTDDEVETISDNEYHDNYCLVKDSAVKLINK